MSASNVSIHILNGQDINSAVHNNSSLYMGRSYITRKSNKNMRRLTTATSSTSSALALLAFLFFLNVLQRSLDDNKQQGPIVMTRTTTTQTIKPRNNFIENKQLTVKTISRDNNSVSNFENIFNKYLK